VSIACKGGLCQALISFIYLGALASEHSNLMTGGETTTTLIHLVMAATDML
jgi:hypothetical protein